VEASKVDCVPMQLFPNPLQMAEPGPRMYIIGHPGGRDLEFSLNDNRLIACSDEKLHYRTPTEGGSSGSPIFDPVSWQVVGLHHAGRTNMPKLNGPVGEFYQANEGIAILAIMRKTLTLP
ncbi:MAG TPA: serine protease, partial [Candidatus Acidoferrum sp.]|nr:serine protease [Candidatus Acidoferrum sp.]